MNIFRETYFHHRKEFIELFLYGVFGFAAFFVNTVTFYIFANVLGIHYMFSNALAWLISTTFAFFTNKQIVFKSHGKTAKKSAQFLSARILTLLIDMSLIWFTIKCMHLNTLVAKIFVNIIVIATNYVFSKFWIFKEE